MILRYRDENNTEHVIAASYIELEDVMSGEIHNGKWIFKESVCYSCKGMRICEDAGPAVQECKWFMAKTATYSAGHNEEQK